MRKLTNRFMQDLIHSEGLLHSLLLQIRKDHTLMLAIRNGYINIYYRGGNLLKVSELKKGEYKVDFDHNYNKTNRTIPDLPATISHRDDINARIEAFPLFKQIMDEYFTMYQKAEREFQQLITRENNLSPISSKSEYFITDIEFNDPQMNARFDLLGIRWLASQRKRGNNCKPTLMEFKYGDGALNGKSGLLKHLEDMTGLIANSKKYTDLVHTIETQFSQLCQLELIQYNIGKYNDQIQLNPSEKPEIIIILANHNPRSTVLKSILSDPEIEQFAQSPYFDLRFFMASFAGYGFFERNMLLLEDFRKYL